MWKILYEKRVQKDLDKLKKAGLVQNAKKIIEELSHDPFSSSYEKLVGDLSGLYSRRINIKHRLVYKIQKQEKIIVVISMWSHYGD